MKVDVYVDRINRGLSRAALADEMGVSEDVIRQLEKTGRRPHPSNALKVAEHYKLTVLEMWPGEAQAPVDQDRAWEPAA
jgi:ribosome-binding protein aMBF1 (putative translation factor)